MDIELQVDTCKWDVKLTAVITDNDEVTKASGYLEIGKDGDIYEEVYRAVVDIIIHALKRHCFANLCVTQADKPPHDA